MEQTNKAALLGVAVPEALGGVSDPVFSMKGIRFRSYRIYLW